jgi:hypothetical protein
VLALEQALADLEDFVVAHVAHDGWDMSGSAITATGSPASVAAGRGSIAGSRGAMLPTRWRCELLHRSCWSKIATSPSSTSVGTGMAAIRRGEARG